MAACFFASFNGIPFSTNLSRIASYIFGILSLLQERKYFLEALPCLRHRNHLLHDFGSDLFGLTIYVGIRVVVIKDLLGETVDLALLNGIGTCRLDRLRLDVADRFVQVVRFGTGQKLLRRHLLDIADSLATTTIAK